MRSPSAPLFKTKRNKTGLHCRSCIGWSRISLTTPCLVDPRGRPTVTAGRITIFPYVVCTSPYFKISLYKKLSSENSDRYWLDCGSGRVDYWWHTCLVFRYSNKRGIDFGLGRGYSGNQAAKHIMGLVASQYAGGPGKRKRMDPNLKNKYYHHYGHLWNCCCLSARCFFSIFF